MPLEIHGLLTVNRECVPDIRDTVAHKATSSSRRSHSAGLATFITEPSSASAPKVPRFTQ